MARQRNEATETEREQELVQIAYRHIVARGFEGLRVRDIAEEAGINNATLHYYFPTKETLIQGVVAYLLQQFQTNHPTNTREITTALDALRVEFEDVGYRLREMPEMYVVLTELSVRARRDPAIAAILKGMEDNWHAYIRQIVRRGIEEGTFRPDLDIGLTAICLMTQIRALSYQVFALASTDAIDRLIECLLSQIEGWLVTPTPRTERKET